MWITLALLSSLSLGLYDVMKKLSLRDNNVLMVLLLNTLFGTLLMSPVLVSDFISGTELMSGSNLTAHLLIFAKSVIVLISWLLGYFAIKHLPLTIQGPINATRPVMVLIGALLIFGERLNLLQWTGVIIGFASLFLISRAGSTEGFSLRHSQWIWMSIGATMAGAVSALYDKYLISRIEPLQVQAWFAFYQCIIMGCALTVINRVSSAHAKAATPFRWRWTILFISIFLTAADMAYFYSLSIPGSMVAIVSMIRRGSVIVPFMYGVFALHEKNIKAKSLDLLLLIISLTLIVIGS